MIQLIQSVLKKCEIQRWKITEKKEETAELFFVKKQLDTRRAKDTHKYVVTVFREEEKNGKKFVGETSSLILPGQSEEEVQKAIQDAFFAAQFALNPTYAPAEPVQAELLKQEGKLAGGLMESVVGDFVDALFASDCRDDAFINSAELFVVRKTLRILTSEGTDVSWMDAKADGECVVQCLKPEDVEIFNKFEYSEMNTEDLKELVNHALDFVRDRARAEKILKSGQYDLILSGDSIREILTFYKERAHASMQFAGYSQWKVGENVQDCTTGEPVTLTACASSPYSSEGIPMKDRALIEDGTLKMIYGGTRFCRYLGIEPTGEYRKIRCENKGSMSFEEMKKTPCLWAVTFSDFQMDTFSGHFGGEIRLAYLIDGDKMIPVTGGSVNGDFIEAQKEMVFSTERYSSAEYEGPYAVKFRKINVAGCADDQ